MLPPMTNTALVSGAQRAALRTSTGAVSKRAISSLTSARSTVLAASKAPSSQTQQRQAQQQWSPRSSRASFKPSLTTTTLLARSFHVSAARAAETVKVPQMAESISEGTLKQWNKKKGDFVEADEEVAVIETDKIDVTVNAPQSGTIVETLANEEDTVTVGQDLFRIEPGEAPAEGSSSGGEEKKDEGKDKKAEEEDRKAKEQEESKKQDEQKQQKQQQEAKQQESQKQQDQQKQQQQSQQKSQQPKKDEKKPSAPSSGASSSKPAPGARTEQKVKMNRMRLRIAERLKQSQNTAASLTTFNEIDMSALMAFRARHKDRIMKEQGVKLGFMGAFAKACTLALKEVPAANASIEGEGLGDTIVYKDYVDLSVAVSTDKGLVTPVVRNAESLSILDIEREISALGAKARDNKLTLEDMSGGTFTISNGGVFGSLFGTPILNLPGSAILGMHAIKEKPWVVVGEDGKKRVEIRPIMVVALTYDHRLIDGRESVTLLVKIKQYLEDPASMMFLAT